MKVPEFKWCEVLPESPSPLIELEEKDPVGSLRNTGVVFESEAKPRS